MLKHSYIMLLYDLTSPLNINLVNVIHVTHEP